MNSEQLAPRVREIAESPILLKLGITAAMAHFNAPYLVVREAMDHALVTRSREELSNSVAYKSRQRLYGRVLRAEQRYPMLYRELRDSTYRRVATRYGISYELVGRMARMFADLAVLDGVEEDQLLETIEEEARGAQRTRR